MVLTTFVRQALAATDHRLATGGRGSFTFVAKWSIDHKLTVEPAQWASSNIGKRRDLDPRAADRVKDERQPSRSIRSHTMAYRRVRGQPRACRNRETQALVG